MGDPLVAACSAVVLGTAIRASGRLAGVVLLVGRDVHGGAVLLGAVAAVPVGIGTRVRRTAS
jgi:hypothetical protein